MPFSAARIDELLAHENRERNIGEPTAVQVADLSTADREFDPAEPVGLHRHAVPAGDLTFDVFLDRVRTHS